MNGWANYETWNVTLWIANDERLYRLASDCRSYAEFRTRLWAVDNYASGKLPLARETPDGVSWNDPKLDLAAIGEWWNDTFPLRCEKLASDITEFGIPKGGFPVED